MDMHIKLISLWIIFHVYSLWGFIFLAGDVEQITENTSNLIKSLKV